jgi:hypothetical protein
MVLLPPCRLLVAQEGEQPEATKLGTSGLYEKGAPPTGPYELVCIYLRGHRIAADVLLEYLGGGAEYEEDVTSLLSTAWRFSWTYRTS